MSTCSQCGQQLLRVRRTILQRVWYMAAYQCEGCGSEVLIPRMAYRRGPECRCPECGTTRALTQRYSRDGIAQMQHGLWNFFAWASGGNLYHCNLCRIQFYDRRPLRQPEPGRDHSARSALSGAG